MRPNELDELLTPKDLAVYLSVPLKTVYSHRYTGTGPPGFRVGKHLRFRRQDVAVWIASTGSADEHVRPLRPLRHSVRSSFRYRQPADMPRIIVLAGQEAARHRNCADNFLHDQNKEVNVTSEIKSRRYLSRTEATIVDELYRLQLLSTDQIHRLFDPEATRRWTQHRLRRLENEGWLQRVHTAPPERMSLWFLSRTAHTAVAGSKANRVRVRPRMTIARATNSRARHLLLSNQVGLAFVETARQSPDSDSFSSYDWDLEVRHGYGKARHDAVISDLVLRYLHTTQDRIFGPMAMIELDRGTESIPRLVEKLNGYSRFRRHRVPRRSGESGTELAWANMYFAWPTILIVFADLDHRALVRRMDGLFYRYRSVSVQGARDMPVMMTSLPELENEGPLQPIFRDLRDGYQKAWDRTDAAWAPYVKPPRSPNDLW